MTTNNTTQVPSGVNPVIIGSVIGLLMIAFLVVLIVVMLIVFLLLWKRKRDRKQAGYQPAKKDSRSAGITLFCVYCCKKLPRHDTDNSYLDMKPAPQHDYETIDAVTDSHYHTL